MSASYERVIRDTAELSAAHKEALKTLSQTEMWLAECRDALRECRAGEPPIIVDPPPIDPPPIIVDPPPVKPPTSPDMPWPHELARVDVEQAKTVARERVTPILDAAPARTEMGYDVVFRDLEDAGRNGFISGESRHGRWGKSYGARKKYDSEGNLLPRNVGLGMDNVWYSGPWDDQSTGAKWFVRMSNLPSAIITRMKVVGETLSGRATPKEHGVYIVVSGDVTFADCLFELLGGHGPYIANRSYEDPKYGITSFPFTEAPTWLCDNVTCIDDELDASRSAFNYTFYDCGNYEHPGEVIVKDCASIMAWDFQRNQGTNDRHPVEPYITGETRSSGGMVVTNYNQAHMGVQGQWPTDRVVITRCYFHTVQARHALLNLRGAREYLVKDSTLRAEGPGANKICEFGAKERGSSVMAGPGRVIIENCIAPDIMARIWTTPTDHEAIDMNCPGQRITWTPNGTTVEDI